MTRRNWFLALILLLVLVPGTAWADGAPVNPGVRLGQWITDNVTALFAPILAAVSLYYLAKRQFTRFLSFAVFAAAVALLVYGTGEFQDMAVSFGKWVIGK